MTIDELLNELRELSREWKIEANEQSDDRYGDDRSIDRFTEELDEIIERASEGNSEPSCRTCQHWTEFEDAPAFGRCSVNGGGTSDWFRCNEYERKSLTTKG